MHVLHAHWRPPAHPTDSGGVIFWAETSELPPTRQKRARKFIARFHPFCAAPGAVITLLNSLGASVAPAEGETAILWLPTTSFGPQPSPQLQHDWDLADDRPPDLAPWYVTGFWLRPAAAFHVLVNLPGPESLPPALALGADSRYWQAAATLALEALAQQKVLPGLIPAGRVLLARWLPVLDGSQDGPRLAHLLAAMPPVCRAEADAPEEAPSPRWLLETFLNAVVDSVTRTWCPAPPPLAQSRRSQDEFDPVNDWLQSLFRPDPRVAGSAAQLSHLAQNHQLWLRQLHVAGDNVFRVAFRLEAPLQQGQDPAEKNWRLHYLLQAREDPSLMVPARQVWQFRGSVLHALNRRFEQPQEKLLAGLGYAARFFEPLRTGLKTATPTELSLTSQEAFIFLREVAPLLEASGFGILVPPWWNKPGTRLGVRMKLSPRTSRSPSQSSNGNLGLEKMARYRWELSLGEVMLTREEFEALVALKSPLVQIRGQWVRLDPEQVEAAIRFWEKQSQETEVTLPEAVRLRLGESEGAGGLPVEGVEAEGWLADWLERFTGHEKLSLLPPPSSLQAQLRPYQQYGYSWLAFLQRWGMGACLADDMGLGKTVQTIALLLKEKEETGSLPGPVLVVCPTSVVNNWARETHRFAPALTAMVHQGPDRLRGEDFIKGAAAVDMTLTSYAVVRRDAETMQAVAWGGVILDEAQNIKNPDTQQARAIRRLPAQFRMALTGTPVENRLSELWSIMHFLNPGYLGPQHRFRQKFALPIERYQDEEAGQHLKRLVAPFILRRVKTDPAVIQDLPEKQEMKVYCNLSQEQATLYEAVVRRSMEDIAETDGIQRRGLVLSLLMQLKQICNHPAQYLHQIDGDYQPDPAGETTRSGKLARLTEMVEEALSVEDRILIFTQFAEMGHMLKSHLQQYLGVPALFLHGGTPPKKRAVMVQRFQEEPNGPPIFILSLKAGGTGLNLTRASHVFHFDRWWNPAVENQATDRAFRIGQKQNVQVHKFICAGTMEEMVDDMIESKKALAESIIGSGESWLTELSTEKLRELVNLRREAVA